MDVEFLKKIVATPSPSGFEEPVQALVREKFRKHVDRLQTDVHGNVFGIVNPDGKPRVMIAAHSDEIGFMVKHITDEGYVYFAAVGGVDARVVPAQHVEIHSKKGVVAGVVGRKPVHLMEEEDKKKKTEIHNLWIDIGARNKKDAQKRIRIGDPVTFASRISILGQKCMSSRSFDDKVGVFILTEIMTGIGKKKFDAAVFGVSTVQEELGLRGATTSAYAVEPDVGIAIDVDFSSDYPDIDKKKIGDISLGKGPVLSRGANINPVLGDLLVRVAEEKKIPYQISGSPRATGTDANIMQLTRSGVATAVVGIPNRYMHTPVEMISLNDVENAVKLLVALIGKVKKNMSFIP